MTGTPRRPIDVLHVIHRLGDGGADRALTNLINAADGPHVRHTVLTLHGPSRPYQPLRPPAQLIEAGPDPAEAVAELSRRVDMTFDIVHAWVSSATVAASILAASQGSRLVIRQPTNIEQELRYQPDAVGDLRELRLAFQLADSVVVPSPVLIDGTRRVYGVERVTVIPNAVPDPVSPTGWSPTIDCAPEASRGRPRRRFVVGFVGRLIAQKNPAALIEALARLRGGPDWELWVFGAGGLLGALQRDAWSAGLADRVRFLGSRHDWSSWAAAIDLFVLPTRFEGMSNTLLEAAAAGMAIVTTDVPENRFVLTPSRQCLMVPPNDVPALTEAIATLAAAPDHRRRLGHAARDVAQRFSLPRMRAAYETLYRAVVEGMDTPCAA